MPEVHGDSLELSLEIDPAQAFDVGVKVRCSPDGKEQTAIVYDAVSHQLKIDMTRGAVLILSAKRVGKLTVRRPSPGDLGGPLAAMFLST